MLLAVLLICFAVGAATPPVAGWKSLAPGMELRWLNAGNSSAADDSQIAVVRIDPDIWELELIGRSLTGEPTGCTARDWARSNDLALATNAGMFAADYKTHVGYMESKGQVNSSGINRYQSVAAFHPRDPERHPPFRIFDLDEPGVSMQDIRRDYASVLQNLRLIKRPGTNKWSQQPKKWSEAALGEDKNGSILFVFSRSPFSMHDLNRKLLSAGIDLVAAQHLEGGPEAQLYLKAGDLELELVGSYEISFKEDEGNTTAWPIPNVLGVKRRGADE